MCAPERRVAGRWQFGQLREAWPEILQCKHLMGLEQPTTLCSVSKQRKQRPKRASLKGKMAWVHGGGG